VPASGLHDDVDGEQRQRDQTEQQHAGTLEAVQGEWADAVKRHLRQ